MISMMTINTNQQEFAMYQGLILGVYWLTLKPP